MYCDPLRIDFHGSREHPKADVLGEGQYGSVLWGGSREGWGDILHTPEDSDVWFRGHQVDEEQGNLYQGQVRDSFYVKTW